MLEQKQKKKDENKSSLVYAYVNKGGENMLKGKMMHGHFKREKNMKKMRKQNHDK